MKDQIESAKSADRRTTRVPGSVWISCALASLALVTRTSAQTLDRGLIETEVRPALSVTPVSPSSPSDTVFFNIIHTYSPTDIAAAYGLDALHAEGVTGKGQTIVIVDAYGSPTALQDLQTFSAFFGLPAPDLTVIYPDGQPTLDTSKKLGWAQETSLDLQWAHATAPDAKLVLIASNPAETVGVQGFPGMFKGIQYAIANYPGSPISHSFAAPEPSFNGAADPQLAKYEAIYQQAITAGCTPVAAAGDWGTANPDKQGFGNAPWPYPNVFPYPTVAWPASSPSVTAVGGTWLQYHWRLNPQTNFAAFVAIGVVATGVVPSPFDPVVQAFLNWDATDDVTEAVWREDWRALPFGPLAEYVTGGGLSAVFATPSWQSGLPSSLTQGARALPDISWSAANDGGVLAYCTPAGGWGGYSGTSCGAPQIAGLVALVDQVRASLGKGPIGHLASKLYELPASDFNDIVPQTFGSGADALTVDSNFRFGYDVPGYPTTPGYDLTTGLGSPKAYSLVHDLATLFP